MKNRAVIGGTAILLFVMGLGRLLLSYHKEELKADEEKFMAGLRNTVKETKIRSELAIDRLLKAQGKVFLYTNDSTAEMGWAPNVGNDMAGGVKSLVLEATNMDEFVKKKDSLGFLLLLNRGGKDTYILNKNILFDQNKATQIWFLGLDSKDKLNKDTSTAKRSPKIYRENFVTGWGIGFDHFSELNPNKFTNLPFVACSRYLAKIDGFKFYMAAYENNNNKPGIDSASFAQTIRIINKLLKEEGTDTTKFITRTFSR